MLILLPESYDRRYFDFSLETIPHSIRRTGTSVAVLHGNNQTRIVKSWLMTVDYYFVGGWAAECYYYNVPADYDFVPLLQAFIHLITSAEQNKYKILHYQSSQYYLIRNIYDECNR